MNDDQEPTASATELWFSNATVLTATFAVEATLLAAIVDLAGVFQTEPWAWIAFGLIAIIAIMSLLSCGPTNPVAACIYNGFAGVGLGVEGLMLHDSALTLAGGAVGVGGCLSAVFLSRRTSHST